MEAVREYRAIYKIAVQAAKADVEEFMELMRKKDEYRPGHIKGEIYTILKEKSFTHAVKKYKDYTGLDLAEAQKGVEKLLVEMSHPPYRPELPWNIEHDLIYNLKKEESGSYCNDVEIRIRSNGDTLGQTDLKYLALLIQKALNEKFYPTFTMTDHK